MISEDTVQNCCTDFWLGTPGLPTSVALHAQLLTIQAVRGDLFVPRTIATRLGRQSFFIAGSEFQLSGIHCRFTFAPRPSVAVSFKHGSSSSFQAGLSLTFPQRTIDETELKW